MIDRKLSSKVERLIAWSKAVNIAKDLDDDVLSRIGKRVVDEFDIDKQSRADWERINTMAMKVARQIMEEKTHPWPGAANVKYPLITTASIQFAARAYPEIVKDNAVVKAHVIGEDPENSKEKRAERVSAHMSWQCLHEMEEWDEDMDRLCHMLPVMGLCYKKSYFDQLLQRNASPLKSAENVVVHYKARSLETARRITEEFQEYGNGIKEFQMAGLWLEQEIGLANDANHPGDDDAPHDFLEQHRWWDLDEDGYQEPYIVTVHKSTGKVMRIVARYDEDTIKLRVGLGDGTHELAKIEPIHYFTKFGFIPAPDGSFYDVGFGHLLNSLNESVNTILNQLLDAGSLANRQGGFIDRGVKFGKKQAGPLEFRLGEWKWVEAVGGSLKDKIFPLPAGEPSRVLFQLLGLLIEAGKELASVKDVLTGQSPGNSASPTTTLALIEQGVKVFVGIYKRIYRALGKEFQKLYRLNRIYSNPKVVFRVLDVPYQVFRDDYNSDDLDILPVADPNLSTDLQRLAKAQALLQISGRPGLDEYELTETYVDALQIPNKNKIMVPREELQGAPPDPALLLAQGELQIRQQELMVKAKDLMLKEQEMLARIEKLRADGILSLARAEALSADTQLDRLKLFIESLDAETQRMHELRLSQMEKVHEAAQKHFDRGHTRQIEELKHNAA